MQKYSSKFRSLKKRAFLAKMEASLGNVTASCKEAGIDRKTYYNWLKADESFAAAVSDIEETNLDFAESCLKQQIRDGNTSATIFFLKTKGRSRGYVESLDVKGDLSVRANYDNMTAEQLKEEAARLKDIIDLA